MINNKNINKLGNVPKFLGTYSMMPESKMSYSFDKKLALTGDMSLHLFNVEDALSKFKDTCFEIANLIAETQGILKMPYNPECKGCEAQKEFTLDPKRELPNWKLRTVYRIQPSSLGFAWENCKRCFINSVGGGKGSFSKVVFPPIIGACDRGMKNYFSNGPTDLIEGIPDGGKILPEVYVSLSVWYDFLSLGLSFLGKPEGICLYGDKSFGVIDYKLSEPKMMERYMNQLACYSIALNYPDKQVHDHLGISLYSKKLGFELNAV